MSMKLVLLKDVSNVGSSGSIVDVSDGYGRYLIMEKLASVANRGSIQDAENKKSSKEFEMNCTKKKSRETFDKINGKTLSVFIKAGESGKPMESVTSAKLYDAIISKFNVEIPKKGIYMDDEQHGLKTFGMHTISVKLDGLEGVFAKLNVNVEQSVDSLN